jgi:hypothetical protein
VDDRLTQESQKNDRSYEPPAISSLGRVDEFTQGDAGSTTDQVN